METYGEFESANDHIADPDKLDELFEQKGYLFFRGVLDKTEVASVREDFVRELQHQGFVKPG